MAATASCLQAIKEQGKSVVFMLYKLIRGEAIQTSHGPYTTQIFVKEWRAGGKKLIEQYWRDAANQPTGNYAPTEEYDPSDNEGDRDAFYEKEIRQGKHEWIPTDMLGYLVEMAFYHKDPGWLILADGLRIPTRFVVVIPAKVGALNHALTGHVGALYIPNHATRKFRRITKGQATFHNVLRKILTQYLNNATNSKKGYEDALFKHIGEYYWHGRGYPKGCQANSQCPYFFNSGVGQYSPWGRTMSDMAEGLAAGWENWLAIMRNVFKATYTL